MCMFKRVWEHRLLYLCLVCQISPLCVLGIGIHATNLNLRNHGRHIQYCYCMAGYCFEYLQPGNICKEGRLALYLWPSLSVSQSHEIRRPGEFYVVRKSWSTDLDALKLGNDRSGCWDSSCKCISLTLSPPNFFLSGPTSWQQVGWDYTGCVRIRARLSIFAPAPQRG